MPCATGTIKYMVYAFNAIFAITGLSILVAGIVVLVNISEYKHFVESSIFSPPIILIIAGLIIFVVASVGCFGAIKESPKLLFVFLGCLIFIFVLEIIAGIIAAVYRSDLDMALQGHLKSSLDHYNANDGDKVAWDNVQHKFKCCGVNGPTDWLVGSGGAGQRVMPFSCCHALKGDDPEPTETQCRQAIPSDSYVYQEGCYNKLYMKLNNAATTLFWFAIVVAVIQLFGIGLALWFALTLRKEQTEK